MTYYVLYQITNTVNNKIYIGLHQTTRIDDRYMGSGKLLKLAIKKYGIASFKKDILHVYDNLEDVIAAEIEIVTEEFCRRKDTYNIMPGGKFGSRRRNGLTFEGKAHTEQTKETIRNASTGRLHSEETKKQMSENNFAKRDSDRQRESASNAGSYEKTQPQREKISASLKEYNRQNQLTGQPHYNSRPKPKVECPYCDKTGAMHVMSRWHFDNCKNKF